MRTIQLTHEEIETIKTALQYVYDRQLDYLQQNKKIIGEENKSKVLEEANKFFNTQDVFDGWRDV
jgi:acyl-[acyl carrier protein]--UDP-N-acetylglucosamine O-acyltransferase